MSLSYKLRSILFKYADGKPTLVFCSTRKGVEHTCSTLTQQITFHFSTGQKDRISEVATTLSDNKLKECVMAGVGYHHAGMGKEDRQVRNTTPFTNNRQ
jgi:ATP-dependent DNA helicase HFM1/MER3